MVPRDWPHTIFTRPETKCPPHLQDRLVLSAISRSHRCQAVDFASSPVHRLATVATKCPPHLPDRLVLSAISHSHRCQAVDFASSPVHRLATVATQSEKAAQKRSPLATASQSSTELGVSESATIASRAMGHGFRCARDRPAAFRRHLRPTRQKTRRASPQMTQLLRRRYH